MAKKKKAFATDPAVVAAYKKMLEGVPEVTWKGATAPYTSLNGNMYSAISKMDIIGLRLSKEDMAIFLKKYDATLFEPFPGFIQKTYVAVPPVMYGNTRAMRQWFRKSYAFACTLKPKKTTRN